ncbi:protein of unknown function [Methylorubrum extorquens]|uniref:Uncharacterized protein n=1 Tax=Methylorubrum extorquens TaxID=408 RepID=A0A2N9AN27_METEX|nr:protein of unknown function [Methylorubrum extorquens]
MILYFLLFNAAFAGKSIDILGFWSYIHATRLPVQPGELFR